MERGQAKVPSTSTLWDRTPSLEQQWLSLLSRFGTVETTMYRIIANALQASLAYETLPSALQDCTREKCVFRFWTRFPGYFSVEYFSIEVLPRCLNSSCDTPVLTVRTRHLLTSHGTAIAIRPARVAQDTTARIPLKFESNMRSSIVKAFIL